MPWIVGMMIVFTISAAVSPVRTTAGECAPMPPVFGPVSPSNAFL